MIFLHTPGHVPCQVENVLSLRTGRSTAFCTPDHTATPSVLTARTKAVASNDRINNAQKSAGSPRLAPSAQAAHIGAGAQHQPALWPEDMGQVIGEDANESHEHMGIILVTSHAG